MKESVKEEIQKLMKKYHTCNKDNLLLVAPTIEEFIASRDWEYLCEYGRLSEDFIREFQNKVDWKKVSESQKLSEEFIWEFRQKVVWHKICASQRLSEEFLRKAQDFLNQNGVWARVATYQRLSEKFIIDYIPQIHASMSFSLILKNQNLSKEFLDKYDNGAITYNDYEKGEYKDIHRETTREENIKEMKEYAEKYKLKFDGEYLYAFRNHDEYGRGMWNRTIFYETGKYYHDWHCDMRRDTENSFGLGIFPKGNTPVRVKVEDWGVCVSRKDGKCRVWGFEVL